MRTNSHGQPCPSARQQRPVSRPSLKSSHLVPKSWLSTSGKSRHQGPPTRTLLSNSRTSQPEKTEIPKPNWWPPTRTVGVDVGPRRCTSKDGDCGRNKYLQNVWDSRRARRRSCQAKWLSWLDLRDGGSPAWIRTTITLSSAESVSYRLFNGLKCRIGPEIPALVHNSYTGRSRSRCPVSGSRMGGCCDGLWGSGHQAKSPSRSGSFGGNVSCSVWQ